MIITLINDKFCILLFQASTSEDKYGESERETWKNSVQNYN